MKQSPSKKPPTAGSWKPGQSGNPNGRPRSGLALAEAIRERVDPHKVIDLVVRHLEDEDVPVAQRLAAVLPWMHSGFLKPPTSSSLDITSGAERDLSHLSTAELTEMLARIEGRPTDPESSEPGVTVDDSIQDTGVRTP